eukprot:GHUV01006043.1.p1 GENE.GHUV01006043.1~~GHUV01006043.1.p1  ORF type:complete len:144 (+),score=36.66 GHUV01006043.1:364-795(+)
MLAVFGRQTQQALVPRLAVYARHISSSTPAADLRDFLDASNPEHAANGRAWRASELRNKSFDDLHKLWVICLKERNMLLTQMAWESRDESEKQQVSSLKEGQLKRYTYVKKTMNRVKQILSERACNEANAVKAADMKRVIHYM